MLTRLSPSIRRIWEGLQGDIVVVPSYWYVEEPEGGWYVTGPGELLAVARIAFLLGTLYTADDVRFLQPGAWEKEQDKLGKANLVIIGGPRTNLACKRYIKKISRFYYDPDNDPWTLRDSQSEFGPWEPHRENDIVIDYGLLVRAPRPDVENATLTIACGGHSLGTLVAGLSLLNETLGQAILREGMEEGFELVVSTEWCKDEPEISATVEYPKSLRDVQIKNLMDVQKPLAESGTGLLQAPAEPWPRSLLVDPRDLLGMSWEELVGLDADDEGETRRNVGTFARGHLWIKQALKDNEWVAVCGPDLEIIASGSVGEWPSKEKQKEWSDRNDGIGVFIVERPAADGLLAGGRASATTQWPSDEDRVLITVLIGHSAWTLQESIDQGAPVKALLDTGSPYTYLDPWYAAEVLGLEVEPLFGPEPINTALGTYKAEWWRSALRVILKDESGKAETVLFETVYAPRRDSVWEMQRHLQGKTLRDYLAKITRQKDLGVVVGADLLCVQPNAPEVTLTLNGRTRITTVRRIH